jgi:hypothetical protein
MAIVYVFAALFLALLVSTGMASAGNSTGALSNVANFENSKAMASGTGWNWTGEGDNIKIAVFLASGVSTISEIEVFVGAGIASASTPSLSQKVTSGTVFPTGTNIVFTGKITGLTAGLNPGTTKVGIHLVNASDTDVVQSAAPANTGLVDLSEKIAWPAGTTTSAIAQPANTPVPAPTAAPTATPVLPATGDLSLNSGLAITAVLIGLLMVSMGGIYTIRSRKARS